MDGTLARLNRGTHITAGLIAAALSTAAPALALDAATLRGVLAREARLLGPAAGAYVLDLDSGHKLFARHEYRRLAPASNEKLFVTAAALLALGPDATLATQVRVAPEAQIALDGALHGDLVLAGGGDPALDDRDLRLLADAVEDAGITRITGGIAADESLFDARRGSFDTGYKPDSDLGGWLGALAWGHGRAFPGASPALVAATRFHEMLKARAIRPGRRPRIAAMPAAVRVLGRAPSPPMRTLATITNQPSDNFYAEMLVKALGALQGDGGTTPAGLAVVRRALAPLGVRPRLRDGSGLSRADRTSAREVVRLLAAMAEHEVEPHFTASLPRAGRDGTLRHRLRGTAADGRCRAKTGTLIGVSALSGYCETPGGRVAFSFIENRVCAVCAKQIEDRMLVAIARYDGF